MARVREPKGKLVRKFGVNIFGNPKFDRLLAKKNYSPGAQGRLKRKGKMSDFGVRLREKQKLRFMYGIMERQFRKYYEESARKKGNTGLILLQNLESRLDNIIFRMGFASTREQARQWVTHGHFAVNGKKLNIPSAQVSVGEEITVIAKSPKIKQIMKDHCAKAVKTSWCDSSEDHLKGKMVRVPNREELDPEIQENLIIEFYSR